MIFGLPVAGSNTPLPVTVSPRRRVGILFRKLPQYIRRKVQARDPGKTRGGTSPSMPSLSRPTPPTTEPRSLGFRQVFASAILRSFSFNPEAPIALPIYREYVDTTDPSVPVAVMAAGAQGRCHLNLAAIMASAITKQPRATCRASSDVSPDSENVDPRSVNAAMAKSSRRVRPPKSSGVSEITVGRSSWPGNLSRGPVQFARHRRQFAVFPEAQTKSISQSCLQ